MRKLQESAEAARRTAIDRPAKNRKAAIDGSAFRAGLDQVAEPSDGLDQLDAELLAQTPDEDLDRIRVAVEVLVVEMLGQLAAGDDAAGMVHQVREQAVF